VHKFIFNEVKTIADPSTSTKRVFGIQPEGTVGAQDMQKVKAAMALLKSKSEKLGPAKIEGTDTVEGKAVPTVFFGITKMNDDFTLVDEIVEEVGGTAAIFVKSGDDYVRVATNVKKDDGSRAIGTILDPKGKAIEFINMNEAFYGSATILGKPYLTGYEPMHDASNHVIGIYYFGYMVSGSLTARLRGARDIRQMWTYIGGGPSSRLRTRNEASGYLKACADGAFGRGWPLKLEQ
jgi:Cache 3/Cache 2 fusion domain